MSDAKTFSDDDLERLKERCGEYEELGIRYADGLLSREDVEAMLFRLAAAEACVEECGCLASHEMSPTYKAWLRACGKAV